MLWQSMQSSATSKLLMQARPILLGSSQVIRQTLYARSDLQRSYEQDRGRDPPDKLCCMDQQIVVNVHDQYGPPGQQY